MKTYAEAARQLLTGIGNNTKDGIADIFEKHKALVLEVGSEPETLAFITAIMRDPQWQGIMGYQLLLALATGVVIGIEMEKQERL